MPKLWTPTLWLPPRRGTAAPTEQTGRTRPNRAAIRAAIKTSRLRLRDDGSPYSKPSLDARRTIRRHRNRAAAIARKESR